MPNNVQTITVSDTNGSGKALVLVTGATHAAYNQRVEVTIVDSSGASDSHTFNGTGENVPFTSIFQKRVSSLPATVTFTFTYSINGVNYDPAPRSQQATLHDGQNAQFYQVTSEDATDNDDNDSYMYCSVHHHG